ncbi:MAG TPA: hypothetical protein P5080_04060 [Candidatus Paceibacterota bacterium]|nr:hypothetical protein [Candidatus Pacearchaeota archaeon]HRZ51144.1 hypothetical protein [Candidatus Paceibacterota bacterium]HSA36849.1 hypothetical protein [Candidatus Paceibacterota bacterium]
MNNNDQWQASIDLGLANGDLAAARKLMADPTMDRLAKASELLHKVRDMVNDQKYPNGSWSQVMTELMALVNQYEHS